MAFPELTIINMGNTRLEGPIPAFNNKQLIGIVLDGCLLNSTLDLMWRSLVPIRSLEAGHNQLSGSLPDVSGALGHLNYLNLQGNQLKGTVPLAWLQPGGSAVSYILS